MWSVQDDLLRIETSKDVCCNLLICFQIQHNKLAMTVCNRSNDLLWGMLGANVVHFSFLQEYMAAKIGVAIGHYHHFTNNLHVYTERKDWQPQKLIEASNQFMYYYEESASHFKLVEDPERFDKEVIEFINNAASPRKWEEPFLNFVAFPMCWAFRLYKNKEYRSALNAMQCVKAEDWKIAGIDWLTKRKERSELKEKKDD